MGGCCGWIGMFFGFVIGVIIIAILTLVIITLVLLIIWLIKQIKK